MGKVIKYFLVTLGWLMFVLILLVLLALILIQTKPFKEKLIALAEKQSTSYINGVLTIGNIEGDFFTHLTLKDVLLRNNTDTIAHVDELEARYELMPLLHKKIVVTKLQITNPDLHLQQVNDTTWNVQQIMKTSTQAPVDTTASKTSSWDIKLAHFRLINGNIKIHSPDTLIPRELKRINTELSLQMVQEQTSLQLKNLSFLADHPFLELKGMTFNLKMNPQLTEVSDFIIATSQNQLIGHLQYFASKNKKSSAILKSAPLHLKEFKAFLPDIKSQATPVINLQASMQNDSISGVIVMAEQDQKINLKLRSPNLYNWIVTRNDSILRYKLDGNLQNIHLVHWLGMSDYNYTLNGDLSADGKGTDPKTAIVQLKGVFENCIVEDKKIDHLDFDMNYDRGNLSGLLNGNGSIGGINLRATVNNVLKTPRYHLVLKASNLDVGPFAGIDTLHSSINLTAEVTGSGINPKTLSCQADLNLSPSRIQNIQVNSAKASVNYRNENLRIDSLQLQTQTLSLKAMGNYSLKSASDLLLSADLKSMEELSAFTPVSGLKTSGHLDAHLTGTKDSLNLNANVHLPETVYGDYTVGNVNLIAHAGITPKDTLFNARLTADHLISTDFQLDSASIDLDGTRDTMLMKAHLANKDLDTRVLTGIQLGALMKINLYQLAVNYKNQDWALTQPSLIEIGSNEYKVNNLNIANLKGDSAQQITANGIINRDGSEDFKLQIKNIDIEKLAKLTQQKLPASGSLDFNLDLQGSAREPVLNGDFAINKAILNNFKFSEFGGKFDYKTGQMAMDMNIVPRDSGAFTIQGRMPIQLRLDSMSYKFSKKDSIDLTLNVDKFPLAALGTISMVKQMAGYLEGGVRVRGSLDSPDMKGDLQLKKAALKVPEYGIDYRDIIFKINFLNDKIRLDTLHVQTGKGRLTGSGVLNFSSDFYKGNISNSTINLKFNGFKPINQRQVNMQITGNTNIGGTKGNVTFGGQINVDQSELYLPALFTILGKVNAPEIPEPLLIRARDSLSNKLDTLIKIKPDTAKHDSAQWTYFNNLRGKISVKIPKNSWIKNESMYVELSGDLDLIKNRSFFELFGTVNIIRGQYELLGRKLVISKGTVTFDGGEQMLPEINLEASYAFRNTQRIQQTLTVDVIGRPDSLAVTFKLDDNSIDQGDALSYLLFGKGLNELSLNQQASLSGGSNNMAEMVAASLISSQLTKFLGDRLNLDYFEIKSQGLENTTVTVGKYITKDLFASYEQHFGQTSETGEPSYVVNLEYEILKFLYLQLNNSSLDNGFDIIFKLQSK